MMRILVLFTMIFSACSHSGAIPKNILPPEKIEEVLYDVIQADEMVDFQSLSDSTFRPTDRRWAFYDTVFYLHGITKDAFQKSLAFYQTRPDLLKPVLASLQRRADTVSLPKKDTLKRNIDTVHKVSAIPVKSK